MRSLGVSLLLATGLAVSGVVVPSVAVATSSDGVAASEAQVAGDDLVVGARLTRYPFRVHNLDTSAAADSCIVSLQHLASGKVVATRQFTADQGVSEHSGTLKVRLRDVAPLGAGRYGLGLYCGRTDNAEGPGGTEPYPVRMRWGSETWVTEGRKGKVKVHVLRYDSGRWVPWKRARAAFQLGENRRWETVRVKKTSREGLAFFPRPRDLDANWRIMTKQTKRVAFSATGFYLDL